MTMTNRQLLAETSGRLLTGIERQRQFLLRQFIQPKPCPVCAAEFNRPQGAGVDLDDYDAGSGPDAADCPSCGAPVRFVLPIMGGWHWSIDRDRARVTWEPAAKPRAFYALSHGGAVGPRLTAGPFAERADAEAYASAQRCGWTVEER